MSSFDDPVPAIPNPPNLSKLPHSSDSDSDDEPQTFHDAGTHFSPSDEASLVAESNATKSEANTLFSQKRYSEAISTYDRALASCPNYLDYEIAVLKSNMSACHIQLEDWKAAVDSATEALEGLDRIDPPPETAKQNKKNKQQQQQQQHGSKKTAAPTTRAGETQIENKTDNSVIEIPSDEEDDSAFLQRLSQTSARQSDIRRIRTKSLLRRARARHQQPTWAPLAGAEEDYRLLLSLLTQTPTTAQDMATVRHALSVLPAEIATAKEQEMGEMMGKLKELGNGILKPFGLSTENFKMVKDEKTGGYSMNFEGGGGK